MKKLLTTSLLVLLAALFYPVHATNVSGNVSGIWTLANSPYDVTGDVTVPSGQTLEIRPGVQVLFTGHYKFNVFGNLQAIGTEQDSIVFTRAFPTEESKWWGIRFLNAGSANRLQYCVIEFGNASISGNEDDHGGGVYCINTSPVISHCNFRHNSASWAGGGLCAHSCTLQIDSCVLALNSSFYGGGALFWDCSVLVTGCVFANNNSTSHGGAVAFAPTGQLPSIFTRCTFVNNASPTLGGGIYCNDRNVSTNSCIVWANSGPGYQACGNITYSDIQGGYSGTGNINADPMFVDTANGDFHLLVPFLERLSRKLVSVV